MAITFNYSQLKHVVLRTNHTITFPVAAISYYAHVGTFTNVNDLIVHNYDIVYANTNMFSNLDD